VTLFGSPPSLMQTGLPLFAPEKEPPMRFPVLTAVILSLAAAVPNGVLSADADQTNGGQVYVKVEHLLTRLDALSAKAQEQITQSGVASGKSMLGARSNLAAAVASGKASVLDSYTLTVPSGIPVRFAPGSKSKLGVKVAVTPDAAAADLKASVEFSFEALAVKKNHTVPNGEPTAWLLAPDASGPDGRVRMALLTFTRVPPRPAE
jgi:hypothetical protein